MRFACLVLLTVLSACAASPVPTPTAAPAADPAVAPGTAPGGMPNMANPASVYCSKVGGTLEIRHDTDGDAGYCHLPDGRVVEEWTLFHEANPG